MGDNNSSNFLFSLKQHDFKCVFDDVFDHESLVTISDDEEKNDDKNKRRRSSSSSSSDQIKIYESLAKSMKENHAQKLELFQKTMESTKPQTELELYFSSICKSVEKLDPIEQTRIKMQISQMVGQAELTQLQSQRPPVTHYDYNQYHSGPSYSNYSTSPTNHQAPTNHQPQNIQQSQIINQHIHDTSHYNDTLITTLTSL